jgi:protein-L-isoaspartate(D-aspartate) O-methyltransferase
MSDQSPSPGRSSAFDAVAQAARDVPAERFHGADGQAVRPCTPAAVTLRHLRLLDVRPGARILEVGTGSGYSAALLARLAGATGRVTTVDIDPRLSRRAEELYAAHGHAVTTVVGDGLSGFGPQAPYDRVFAGTTAPVLPDAWLRQLAPGGALLAGVRLSTLPGAYALVHLTTEPERVTVHHGGYTPVTNRQARFSGAHAVAPDRPALSLSAVAPTAPAGALLAALRDRPHIEEDRGLTAEDYFHFKNWLIAVGPAGLIEATLDQGTGIGVRTTGSGAALVTGTALVADAPGSPARGELLALIARWRAGGAPRTHEQHAVLEREGDSWRVRVSCP